jgi:hypothetical protein
MYFIDKLDVLFQKKFNFRPEIYGILTKLQISYLLRNLRRFFYY